MMRLALFDLDHTLIPFDSTLRWLRFLAGAGEIEAGCAEAYLDLCRSYVAGATEVPALHACALAPLAMRPERLVAQWQARFAAVLPAELPHAAFALVRRHRDAGDLCCIVTNTCDVVAMPFAAALGVSELVCTRAERAGGCFTGALAGEPCHVLGKLRQLDAWLAARGQSRSALERSCFYSDSNSDRPLLSAVGRPVAVAPDAALRAHARAAGWALADSLERA